MALYGNVSIESIRRMARDRAPKLNVNVRDPAQSLASLRQTIERDIPENFADMFAEYHAQIEPMLRGSSGAQALSGGDIWGLGTASPAGAGPSTLTVTLGKPIPGDCALVINTNGIVVTVDSLKVDRQFIPIGDGSLPAGWFDPTKSNQYAVIPFSDAQNSIEIGVTVSAAGTWGASLVGPGIRKRFGGF